MEKHRKSDQYYIDQYDRSTIEELKKLAELYHKAKKKFFFDPENPKSEKNNTEAWRIETKYRDIGAIRARNKEEIIRSRIFADERKDRLIQTYPVPKNVKCGTCGDLMEFELHMFLGERDDLVFVFKCHNDHLPKKMIYPDGTERTLPSRCCSYCNGDLSKTTKRTKLKLTITETCVKCSKVEITEFDLTPEKIIPINEDDRKKYCTDFIGRKTLIESLEEIASLGELLEKKEQFDYNEFIQKLNISELEKRLSEQLEKSEYLKIQFEKPDVGRYLIVAFSAQDSTNRSEKESIKLLKKTTEKVLYATNWRLMSTDITYNLGFLTGKLKGFSLEEDLIKVAKEIKAKK